MSSLQAAKQLHDSTSTPELDLPPGAVLAGRYRIVRVLALGGMATIYLSHDIILDRPVALKVLRPEQGPMPELAERFLNEARTMARLRNPHVTRVLDYGKVQQASAPDVLFIVLELLDGADLWAALLHNVRLSAPLTARYALEACEGLAEVHSLGIVHLDIKPENLFLAREDDGTESIKLLDFGVSTILSASSAGPHMHMSPLVGSPLYMSPEQMRAMPVDARADIWGLGAVMFECVAGQPAFAASTVSEIRAKVLSEPLPDLRRLNLEVPEEFVCVVERCLKRNPAFRFQNVAELALALEPLAIPSSGSPSERIACLLGIEPTKLIIRNPANELTLDRIDTGKPVSGRTSGIRSHWLLGVSVVLSIAIALGYSSHKYPQKMTWLVAEARHQATSLLGAASR